MVNKKNTHLGNSILNQGSKIGDFIKDKKEHTSAILSETLRNNQRIVTLANAFIDGLPVIGLLKNVPIFLKSLNNDEWKTEIFRFCAILGCTPFELMSRYSGFISHDLSGTTSYYTLSKVVYRSLYSAYIYKKEDINLTEIIKKSANNLDFNARLRVAIMMDEFDNVCNDNENISKIRFNIQNFPKNFNLKKKP